MRYKTRYNYRVVVSALFTKVLQETVKRLAKLAPIKYRRDGSRIIIYADTRDSAEMLAKLVSQYFCVLLTYKYLIPHAFCETFVKIEENK
jgi:tRNA threonylcarbamoyladenosine modification (KEOPS) complex  Pcc1 subunit